MWVLLVACRWVGHGCFSLAQTFRPTTDIESEDQQSHARAKLH
jgi:hypothetical protein